MIVPINFMQTNFTFIILCLLRQKIDIGTCPFGLSFRAKVNNHIKRYMRDVFLGSTVRFIR